MKTKLLAFCICVLLTAVALPAEGNEPTLEPTLQIGQVEGGLLGVAAEVKNTGNETITDIQWKIKLDGGFIFVGREYEDNITELGANETEIIALLPVFGFGPVEIIVSANAEGVDPATKRLNGFVYILFVQTN